MTETAEKTHTSLASSNWDAMGTDTISEEHYTAQEKAVLTKLYEDTLTKIDEREVVIGTVVSISNRDVVVSIGTKSDGLIPLNEFRDTPQLQPGDEVEVYVEEQENAKGQLVLSRKKAKLVRGWEKIQAAQDSGEVLEGFVKRRTKGGLIVDIYGIESFLPGSQIDIKPIRDFDAYVGKAMEVAVVKINYANDNVVVSHKLLIEKSLESQKTEIIGNLEKGQILEGIVKNMTSFGAFVDLGGVDGLLHITDMSWGRVNRPEEVVTLGDKVKVVVTGFDENKKRISLGMKQLTAHPWDALPASVQVGSVVKGKVVNIVDYGAFLEILPGVEGLIYVTEMSWSQYLRNTKDLVKVGEEIEAMVLMLDREEKKMSLGVKQLTADPWEKEGLMKHYAAGTRHQGTVRNMIHFGVFVELEEGIDGLLHVSDLSWTQKVNPNEVFTIGDKIEVIILEIDKESRKVSLGVKQLEENPWDTYETMFQVGSTHQGTVTKRVDKGSIIELPHGIEGFSPRRHLFKEDGKEAALGEELNFRVLEFSKNNRKILLSHTNIFSEKKAGTVKSKARSSARQHGHIEGDAVSKGKSASESEAAVSEEQAE
ncbi:MAG: 30S ribosomal protein S1 [Bacteroidota bacterium]